MRHLYYKLMFLSSILLIPLTFSKVQAKEKQGTTIVAVSYTNEDSFQLAVTVKGKGYVLDGSQKIQAGTVQYALPLDMRKTFTIVSEKGYQIKKITYVRPEIDSREDITENLNNKQLSIDVESTKMHLIIEFESKKVKPTKPTETQKPSTPDGSQNKGEVKTGDTTILWKYFIGILLSSFLLIFIRRKRKATY